MRMLNRQTSHQRYAVSVIATGIAIVIFAISLWIFRGESKVERYKRALDPDAMSKAWFWLTEKLAGEDPVEDRLFQRKMNAIKELGSLGSNAVPAAKLLVEELGSEDTFLTFAAADTLIRIGPTASPALTEALLGTNIQVRIWAISLLGDIHKGERIVVPLVRPFLSDTNSQVVAAAIYALGRVGPPAADLANEIRAMFLQTNSILTLEAVEALWRIKQENHLAVLNQVIPDLPKMQQKRAEQLRNEIAANN
jgi:HEAT repeat protein